MDVRRRPITEAERELAADTLDRSPRRIDEWAIGFVAPFALLFVPLLILQTWFPALRELQVPILLVLLVLGSLIALALRRRRDARSPDAATLLDLREGMVEESHFEALGALRVIRADRAPAYYLDIGGGRTLHLVGDHLDTYRKLSELPGRVVTSVRLPLTRTLLDFDLSGESLPVEDVTDDDASEPASSDEDPVDGDVLEIPFAEVRAWHAPHGGTTGEPGS